MAAGYFDGRGNHTLIRGEYLQFFGLLPVSFADNACFTCHEVASFQERLDDDFADRNGTIY